MLTQKLLFSQGLCILLITGIWFVVIYIHTYSLPSLYSLIKVSYIQNLAIRMKNLLHPSSEAAEDSLFVLQTAESKDFLRS